jgi:hypothetical protein
MNFWDKVFETPVVRGQQPRTVPNIGRAWWQDQDQTQQVLAQSPAPRMGEEYVLSERQKQERLNQIRKRGHQQISSEEAELIAEYDLAHKDKYLNACPQCGSGNFLPAGTRMAGVIMPTNKCFNCGGGARSPEPAVGGGSGRGSIATRQTDTGGGGGSMFGTLTGVPRSYIPRP